MLLVLKAALSVLLQQFGTLSMRPVFDVLLTLTYMDSMTVLKSVQVDGLKMNFSDGA